MQVTGLMERIANEKDANREHRPWTKDRVLQIMCGGCEGGDNSTKERMMSDAALAATEKDEEEDEEETNHVPPAATEKDQEDKNTGKRKATHLSKGAKEAGVLEARRVRSEHYDPLRKVRRWSRSERSRTPRSTPRTPRRNRERARRDRSTDRWPCRSQR